MGNITTRRHDGGWTVAFEWLEPKGAVAFHVEADKAKTAEDAVEAVRESAMAWHQETFQHGKHRQV